MDLLSYLRALWNKYTYSWKGTLLQVTKTFAKKQTEMK